MTTFLQHNIGLIIAVPTLAIVIFALRATWLECRESLRATIAEMDRSHKEWEG